MIYNYRYKTLKQKSEPVYFPDPTLPELVQKLWDELAKSNNGIGVAANQIGILKQVGVIKFPSYKTKTPLMIHKTRAVPPSDATIPLSGGEEIEVPAAELVLINPSILELKNEYEVDEGCLSYPGIYAKIKRYRNVVISNYKLDGTVEQIEAEGLLAQAIQHESDHFQGLCFTDHFTQAQRVIYENRIRRIK